MIWQLLGPWSEERGEAKVALTHGPVEGGGGPISIISALYLNKW